jgi:hypothetical protein
MGQPSPAVRRIEQAYLESDYEGALQACQAVLRNERAVPTDRQEALKYMGTIFFAQDNAGEARSAFVRLLRDDPRYRLPADWPPRVLEFFERLRAEALPPPRIRHRVPRGFRLGTPIVVSAQILFLAENHRPRLYYRIEGTSQYSAVDMGRDEGDLYTGIVPTSEQMSPDHDTRVQYYIAVEEGTRVVLTEGNAGAPHSFVVGRVAGLRNGDDDPDRRPPSSGGAPWLLIGLSGAAAVALGVGAFFLLSSAAAEETGSVGIDMVLPE